MSLLSSFDTFIKKHLLFNSGDQLLLGVSGGLDSVVMTELCFRSCCQFSIAHCNFQLREKESDRDEEFVMALGGKYGVEVLAKKFDTEKYASDKKVSIQVAARELRYAWFHDLIESKKLKWIVTAHHLDDNIETVLMNFFKGTGISGLRGMLPKAGKIVRPLLFVRKEELLHFAKENNLNWVEDSSNQSDKYSRNYLRHQLIPIMEKLYPSVIENLGNTIERFREIEKFHEAAFNQQLKKLIEVKGEEVHIPILKLKKMDSPKTIIYELIWKYGFHPAAVDEVLHLMESETGKYLLSSSYRILKNRNWLIISPLDVEQQEQVVVEKGADNIPFQAGQLSFKHQVAAGVGQLGNNGKAHIDEEKISYPLLLRKWRPGDYFYPLGMTKKKKLSRFFIDQKLSLAEKEKIWVIEMNKKIVWVVGLRIDDRFKITPNTKNVLEISFLQKVLK